MCCVSCTVLALSGCCGYLFVVYCVIFLLWFCLLCYVVACGVVIGFACFLLGWLVCCCLGLVVCEVFTMLGGLYLYWYYCRLFGGVMVGVLYLVG